MKEDWGRHSCRGVPSFGKSPIDGISFWFPHKFKSPSAFWALVHHPLGDKKTTQNRLFSGNPNVHVKCFLKR